MAQLFILCANREPTALSSAVGGINGACPKKVLGLATLELQGSCMEPPAVSSILPPSYPRPSLGKLLSPSSGSRELPHPAVETVWTGPIVLVGDRVSLCVPG